MKRVYEMLILKGKIALATLFCLITLSSAVKATSYTWNGSVSSSWGEPNNWTPSGIPDLGDDVSISSTANNPVFEEISGLNNFTINSGSLDMSLFTLVIYGTATFNGGTLSNGNINCQSNVVFAGTTFNVEVTVASSDISFTSATTFNNPVSFTKTGSNNFYEAGGNTFNSTFSLTNSGTGEIRLATTSADTYAGNVTFTNTGSGWISPSYGATGNSYQGNITLNSTGSSPGVRFGQNNGTSTLSSGQTISIGGSGFSSGDLLIKNLTQSGSTAQSITLTGSSAFYIESGCTWNGNVTFIAPQVYLNGATYNGTANITKNGSTSNQSIGGNTFSSSTTITLSGSGDFTLGVSNPDIFNGTSTFTSTGAGNLLIAQGSSGNQFNENILLNTIGSGRGIRFGQGGGTSTLAATKTINIGGAGFTTGTLRIRNLTQVGSTAQSITAATGTAALYLESGTTFNGNVSFSFPQLFLNGSTFNGTADLTKNGATDNTTGTGGNTFASTTLITASGSGRLSIGNSAADIFNGNVTFSSTGSSMIQVALGASGTQFNQNVILNSTGSSTGITIGNSGGTSTLASGKTITVGGVGFSAGDLVLKGLTQVGATAQSITELTSDVGLYLETGTTFNAAVTFTSGKIFLNGTTFSSTALLTQTGPNAAISNGGCTFTGTTTLNKTGDGEWTLASVSPDIFTSDLTLENTGSDPINLADVASGTQFNGNVILNSTGSGGGIRFGQGGGTSTLASTKTITIGSSGFDSGELRIANFTQNGSTSQTLTSFGGSVSVSLEEGSTFNGSLVITSPSLYLNGTTFNASGAFTKTGSAYNLSNGGNTFNGITSIVNTGSGTFIMGGSSSDVFNENVVFRQSNAFTLYPAYNVNCTFAKNISTIGTSNAILFANNGGRVTLNGTETQSIDGSSTEAPDFYNLTINKSSNHVTLNCAIEVTNNLTLLSGRINSSGTNLLIIKDNATVSSVSNSSYVSGPVRKVGDDAFTFPVGKSGFYRPCAISAPSSAGHHFTSEFFLADSDGSYSHSSKDASIDHLSHCEYWTIDRTNGTSNVTVRLSWDAPSCGVTSLGDLLVCRWNGSMWKDHGNGGTTGNATLGTVVSSGSISSFSPFTLGSTNKENPLPINLVHFAAAPINGNIKLDWTTASEINNDYFVIESSVDAINFEEVTRLSGAGNSNVVLNYRAFDNAPHPGVSYYRLKQVDYDGKFMYSNIEVVNLPTLWQNEIVLSPNPVINLLDVRLDPDSFKNPQLELRDIQGKLVLTKTDAEVNAQMPIKLDLQDLPQGLYFLTITENKHTLIKKLIKQ